MEYAFHLSKALSPGIAAVTELSTEDTFPIIWDSGASVSITFDKNNFIGFSSDSELTTLKGFLQGEGQGVKGSGTVKWFIQDKNGQSREIQICAYYVPTSRICLLSITTLLKTYKGESVTMRDDGLILSGVKGSSKRGKNFAPINIQSKLPMSIGRKFSREEEICIETPFVSNGNTNLLPAE